MADPTTLKNPRNRERIAAILAEAMFLPGMTLPEADRFVAKKYGIADRTIRRWRNIARTDAELARMIQEARQPIRKNWREEVEAVASEALEGIRKALKEMDPKSAEACNARVNVFRVLADQERADKVTSAILAHAAQSAYPGPEGGSARVVLLAEGESADDDHVSEAEQASEASLASS
jgi:rubrerythrin